MTTKNDESEDVPVHESFEDKIQVATVDKPVLVSVLFAVFSFLVLGPIAFMIGSKRWKDVLATIVVSVTLGVVLYLCFRKT